eukprot:10083313-Karenia_brevis.AAC.1
MEYGIFVGVNTKSDEFLIADEEGIRRVSSIRRIPKEQKFGVDNLKRIKWRHGRSMKEMQKRMEKYQK